MSFFTPLLPVFARKCATLSTIQQTKSPFTPHLVCIFAENALFVRPFPQKKRNHVPAGPSFRGIGYIYKLHERFS